MVLHRVTVFHNESGRFDPYSSDDELVEVVSHHRKMPEFTEPEQLADWVFHVLNADLDLLEDARSNAGGESAFLLACTYRLLGLRSLSVGDVVAVTVADDTTWLACEPSGWCRIVAPTLSARRSFTDTISRHLRERSHV